MKYNLVLVVFKEHTQIRQTHKKDTHKRVISDIYKILKELKIPYKTIKREKLKTEIKKHKADLIITVGGDGTVLAVSDYANKIPVLGVNSMPRSSRGFFCNVTVNQLKKELIKIKKRKTKPQKLPFLEAKINNKKLNTLALNDVLFSSKTPGETVQYIINANGKKERQRGSGLWIAAGPGSTAGIFASGGKKLVVSSKKIQFLAREICYPNKNKLKLKHGFISSNKSIKIISEVSNASIYLDGKKFIKKISRRDCLEVKISNKNFLIYLNNTHR